ncbi:MAG: DUF2778 domain-containing protein [Bryobacterales bacterium]|nr:DUF2778 domain-containing protein [Bryobacterales bacterium]
MGDYSGERYNPTLPHCGVLTLYFDGHYLRMNGGSRALSYPAVSGKPDAGGRFDYSVARQRIPNTGPIPEGTYWIRPDELDDNYWNTFSGAFARAWGRYRITIHPFTTTETYTRGGFFIHGGTEAGSAGCIDLTTHMDTFAADLIREAGSASCQIHLTVAYPHLGDYPSPGNTRYT